MMPLPELIRNKKIDDLPFLPPLLSHDQDYVSILRCKPIEDNKRKMNSTFILNSCNRYFIL